MTTSSKANNPIKDLLTLFRFHHAAESFEAQAQEAATNNLSHLEFLERVLSTEAALRHERIVQLRIREAKIPVIKTIDSFDWAHPASIPKQMILNALSMSFVERKENIILVGPSGVGKTHIAQSLAYAACQKEMKTLWTTAADIVNTLTAAKADHTLNRVLRQYAAPKLLAVDELGFLPMDKDGSDLFFQVISRRYEQGSIVLTTNRAFKDWGKIFNDNTVASAILDRLVHNAYKINLKGLSMRRKHNCLTISKQHEK